LAEFSWPDGGFSFLSLLLTPVVKQQAWRLPNPASGDQPSSKLAALTPIAFSAPCFGIIAGEMWEDRVINL
jgi:hypothetical protein